MFCFVASGSANKPPTSMAVIRKIDNGTRLKAVIITAVFFSAFLVLFVTMDSVISLTSTSLDRNHEAQSRAPTLYELYVSVRYWHWVDDGSLNRDYQNYLFITLDALLKTPTTAEVMFGAETA